MLFSNCFFYDDFLQRAKYTFISCSPTCLYFFNPLPELINSIFIRIECYFSLERKVTKSSRLHLSRYSASCALPFRSSVQYLTRWSKAPERGLVNVLDHSLPMGQSLLPLLQGYSNALQTSDHRPSSFIELSWAQLLVTHAANIVFADRGDATTETAIAEVHSGPAIAVTIVDRTTPVVIADERTSAG